MRELAKIDMPETIDGVWLFLGVKLAPLPPTSFVAVCECDDAVVVKIDPKVLRTPQKDSKLLGRHVTADCSSRP